MNYESCENFIDFCDDMMIAEEGKIRDAVNKLITVNPKDAVNASDVKEAMKHSMNGARLIRVRGKLKNQISDELKKVNKDFTKVVIAIAAQWGISAGAVYLAPVAPLSLIIGAILGSAAVSMGASINNMAKHGDLASYKIAKGSDGNMYLIRKGLKMKK